mmetsp:Transcript_8449/g.23511  ORF Transcript_8449/g.23511 Transcript_8449/m.23511 type:complete len:252 (-) Transcript_8449:232-987(-)
MGTVPRCDRCPRSLGSTWVGSPSLAMPPKRKCRALPLTGHSHVRRPESECHSDGSCAAYPVDTGGGVLCPPPPRSAGQEQRTAMTVWQPPSLLSVACHALCWASLAWNWYFSSQPSPPSLFPWSCPQACCCHHAAALARSAEREGWCCREALAILSLPLWCRRVSLARGRQPSAWRRCWLVRIRGALLVLKPRPLENLEATSAASGWTTAAAHPWWRIPHCQDFSPLAWLRAGCWDEPHGYASSRSAGLPP